MLILTVSFDRINNENLLNDCLGLGGYSGMEQYSSIENKATLTFEDQDIASEMGFLAIVLRELHNQGFEYTLTSNFES